MRLPLLTPIALTATFALLASAPVAAQTCPGDDGFEENDDCATTAILTAGTHNGLALKGAAHATGLDADYFQITIANGQQVTFGDRLTTLYWAFDYASSQLSFHIDRALVFGATADAHMLCTH